MVGGVFLIAWMAGAAVEVPPCSPAKAPPEPVVEMKDGRKVTEGLLRAGARDGRWTFYWPNGFKKEESSYCSGLRHGPVTFWYENGVPELEGTFEQGVPRGPWTFWSTSGDRRVFHPRPGKASHEFFLDEGSRALVRDELDLATSLLRIAMRNAPDDPKVHRTLGVLSAKSGEAARAAFHYRRYIELDPRAKDRALVESFLAAYEREKAGATSTQKQTVAPQPAPASKTTPVSIITDRAGRVIVDGKPVSGQTPLDGDRALLLSPGPHRIELILDGDPPVSQALSVFVDGEPGAARIELIVGERLRVDGPIVVEPASPDP
jgi:hypothetical protein